MGKIRLPTALLQFRCTRNGIFDSIIAVASSAASSEAVPEAASEAASSEEAKELSTTDALRIAGLKGPTTMGLVNLLSMEEDGTASMDYDLQLYGAADEIVPLLMKLSLIHI